MAATLPSRGVRPRRPGPGRGYLQVLRELRGQLEVRRVELGGSSAGRQPERVRRRRRSARAARGLLLRRPAWPGCPSRAWPCPSSAACLALRALADPHAGHPRHARACRRPLAIDIIILRASKNRSTSSLTSETWRAGARGDPGPARAVDDLRVVAARPGVIDWMIAWIRSISRSSKFSSWSRNCPIPGSIPMIFDSEPILRTCCICCEEVVEGELAALPVSLAGRLGRLLGVEGLLGLLDQGEHVAHAEDPRGHPVGVEDVEVGELLAVRGEHDRLAGDRRDRQRGATAGVAVELGEHHAVVADAVEERLRGRRPRPGRSSRRRRRGSRRG